MFQRIFNPNNLFFQGCSKIFDLVVLSALWLALCLPVVTIGPATAALYYTVVKCIRRGEAEPYKNFFRSFRDNFKVGAVSGVIAAAVGVVLWLGWMMFNLANPEDAGAAFMRTVYTVVLVIPLGVAVYLFPALSRFTFGVGGLYAASFKLAFRHLPSTVIMVLLNVEMVNLSLKYMAPLFVTPALTALLTSLFLERIFKKYTPCQEAYQPEEPLSAHPSMDDLPAEPDDGEGPPWYLK